MTAATNVERLDSHPRYRHAGEHPVRRRDLQVILGCGRTTIFEYLRLGMPHVKTRSQNLFYPSECKAWLVEQGIWRYDGDGLLDPDRRAEY